jgi:hypothetical protein
MSPRRKLVGVLGDDSLLDGFVAGGALAVA